MLKATVKFMATMLISSCIVATSPAYADYYYSKKEAESLTRGRLHSDLGYRWTQAYCRPQGRRKPQKGYLYHRWYCAWWTGFTRGVVNCKGLYILAGSRGAGNYYVKVDYKAGECSNG